MSRWFRHYAGMMRDEKLVRVALRCKQPVERVIWIWGAILESAAEINDGGQYDFDASEAAYFLRADEADILAIEASLADGGRIIEGRVAKWGDRQFRSDNSTERVNRYRSKPKGESNGADKQGPKEPDRYDNVVVTAAKRFSNAPETELDTERKKVSCAVAKATRPADDAFDRFKKAYPKRKGGNPWKPARVLFDKALADGTSIDEILDALRGGTGFDREKVGTEYIPQAVKWLRDRRWEDYATEQPIAHENAPTGFYAAENSIELDAWDQYWRVTKGMNAMRDKQGGWLFPERWPPGWFAEAAE